MPLTTQCPNPSCGTSYAINEDMIGRTRQCKKCGKWFRTQEGIGEAVDAPTNQSPASPSHPITTPIHTDSGATIDASVSDRPDAVASTGPVEWKPGETILDLYEVKEMLGEGAMGEVFRVHHKGWNLDLAVKRAKLIKPGAAEDFERECEVWVNLGLHPNTVSCYYVRRVDGAPCVFAELVEGGDLLSWIRRGRDGQEGKLYERGHDKALERILDIAIQFAWGLEYAHEKGLVHQDVKPANVMMTPDGTVKVTDFGLAKARGVPGGEDEKLLPGVEKSILASSGGMTPAYCSPEQAEGKPLTRSTDIWSWAVSVLEMFVGEVQWPSGSVADAHLEGFLEEGGEAEDESIPKMPDAIAELLRHCFQLDPAARPKDMGDVAGRLEEIYQEVIGQPHPRERPEAAKALADSLNNRALSLFDLGRNREGAQMLEEAHRQGGGSKSVRLNYALQEWRGGRSDDLGVLSALKHAFPSGPQTSEDAQLEFAVHLERGDFTKATEIRSGLHFSSDFEMSLDGPTNRNLNLAKSCSPLRLQLPEAISSVSFSADGKSVFSTGNKECTIRVLQLDSGRPGRPLDGIPYPPMGLSNVAKDGTMISGSTLSSAHVWDTIRGYGKEVYTGHEECVLSSHLLPQSRLAITGSEDKSAHIWEIDTARTRHILRGHDSPVGSVHATDDERYVLTAGGLDGSVRLWRADTGELQQEIHNAPGGAISVRFLPADGSILVGGNDGQIRRYDAKHMKLLNSYLGHSRAVYGLRTIANGEYFLSTDRNGQCRLWNTLSGRCIRTFLDADGTVIAVSPDESRLALGGLKGELYIEQLYQISMRAETPMSLARPVSTHLLRQEEGAFRSHFAGFSHAVRSGEISGALEYYGKIKQLSAWSQDPMFLEELEAHADLFDHSAFKGHTPRWVLKGHESVCTSLCFGPKTSALFTGDGSRRIQKWDLATGSLAKVSHRHKGEIRSLAIDSHSSTLIVGSWKKELIAYDCRDMRELFSYETPGKSVIATEFSPDGRELLVGCDLSIAIYDVGERSPRIVRNYHRDYVTAVRYSPDGRRFASASNDGKVAIWSRSNGKILKVCLGHKGRVLALVWTRCGSYIVSYGEDGVIRVWDPDRGTLRSKIDVVYAGEYMSMDLSPCGRFAVVAGQDTEIGVWDLSTGKKAGEIDLPDGGTVLRLGCSPGGTLIAAATLDSTIQIHSMQWELQRRSERLMVSSPLSLWKRALGWKRTAGR